MKKVSLIVMLLIAVMMIVGCSHNADVSKNADKDDSVSFSASKTENSNSKIVTENESSTEVSTTETTTAQSTTKPKETKKSTTAKTTTAKPDDKKSAGQGKVKKKTQTTTKKQATTQKQTVINKPTTTKKQSTTKEKATASTTAKNKLTKSDVEWVQAQAHSYIRSKGCNVNSSVSSFSGRISTKNFTDKNSLLSEVKEWIDSEYDDCVASGWKTVDMYCKIESRSDGNYFIYVMYG
ncbi:MAG: hypothetical protein ACLUFN_02055 [Eubacterium sp.]